MRTTTTSLIDHLPEALVEFVRRRAAELVGLALMAAAVAMGLALVTWSSRDPSVNHALDGPVRNLLGRPGAMVADLAMQLMGLAAIAALTPIALWGWRLVTARRLERPLFRIAMLVVGALATAGVASLLPITDRWPLPTGLGGVAGDAALAQGAQAVVLAGGLTRRLADRLAGLGFERRFVAKGRFEPLMRDIPVLAFEHPEPGLFGAAAAWAARG